MEIPRAKRTNFLIILFVLIGSNSYGQTFSNSKFYTSFFKPFHLSERSSYQGYNGFHSIKFKTNAKGQIKSYETSLSMTESLKNDVAYAYEKSDKNGLIEFNLKNKTIIIPLFIISSKPLSSQNENMWNFGSKSKPLNADEIILPPIVYYLSTLKSIVN